MQPNGFANNFKKKALRPFLTLTPDHAVGIVLSSESQKGRVSYVATSWGARRCKLSES